MLPLKLDQTPAGAEAAGGGREEATGATEDRPEGAAAFTNASISALERRSASQSGKSLYIALDFTFVFLCKCTHCF